MIKNCSLWYGITFLKTLNVCFDWNFSLIIKKINTFVEKLKNHFSLHNWQSFSLRIMATSRKKRKLAAVSREKPEIRNNGQSQKTIGAGMDQEYTSQVSEEIERRVTEKLSKEFSRTESRFLGALSKLHEFLLNPQATSSDLFRNCSGNFQDERPRKAGTHWKSFLRRSLSPTGVLCLPL